MADFLRSVLEQRRMAQQNAYRQMEFMRHMAQQRSLEEERQRRAQQQDQVQQRILGQSAFGNALRLRELEQRGEIERRRAEEQRKRDELRALQIERGPLKPGFRWESPTSRNQVPVEGGPEWIKLRAAHAGDLNKLQSVNNSTQELVRTIDYILDKKNKSGFTSNFGGWNAYITRLLPNIIPGFAHTSDVQSAIDRLEELAQTSGLGTVRGSSGQSVGSITEREWPKFAAQLLKLSPRMDEDTATMFLKEARANALGIRNRELGAYENEWKPTQFYAADPFKSPVGPDVGRQPSRTPAPKGVAQEDWDAMPDQDKALWNQQPPQQ